MSENLFQKTFKKLSVDAGNVSVYCSSLADNTCPPGSRSINLGTPGTYPVTIEGTVYGEPAEVAGNVTTTTGVLIAGDACYSRIGKEDRYKEWEQLLKDCDFFRKPVPNLLPLETFGDGAFTVTVTVGHRLED